MQFYDMKIFPVFNGDFLRSYYPTTNDESTYKVNNNGMSWKKLLLIMLRVNWMFDFSKKHLLIFYIEQKAQY